MAPSNFSNRAVPRPTNRGRSRPGGAKSKQKSSYIIQMIIIGAILVLVMSLLLGISVLSSHEDEMNALDLGNTSNGNGNKDNLFELYVGPDGSVSENSSTGDDDHAHAVEYNKIREKALEDAKIQTQKRKKIRTYELMLRDSRKHIYENKLKSIEEARQKKKEELLKEEEEMKYYHYYEDSNDMDATAIGITFRSDLITFKRFVGSLRGTGFGGNIIIGVEDIGKEVEEYLLEHDVVIRKLSPTQCTFEAAKERQKCYLPYPHIKKEWSHFPLTRDWLSSCDKCTGPVIFTSVDDTFFQKNPFGSGMPVVRRLHVYEQHPSIDVAKTSAGLLLKACLDIDLGHEMMEEDPDIDPRGILSAATAVGTRDDIIDYLGLIYSIVREWMQRSSCHFQHSSTDGGMAIVNFLRIKDRLPYRSRIMPHRTGIVNNIDFEGQNAFEAHVHLWTFRGKTREEAESMRYETTPGSGSGWIDTDYLVTDEEGFFIDVFFQRSAIVYGYKAFGVPYLMWLDKYLGISDGSPVNVKKKLETTKAGGSYYIEEGKVVEPEPKTTRKEKVEKTGEVVVEKEKIENMYYANASSKTTTGGLKSGSVTKTTGKDDEKAAENNNNVVNVNVVPVEETHEQSENESDAQDGGDIDIDPDASLEEKAKIQLEAVDIREAVGDEDVDEDDKKDGKVMSSRKQ